LRELRMKRKTDLGFWREKGRKVCLGFFPPAYVENKHELYSQEERWKIRTLEHNKQTFEL